MKILKAKKYIQDIINVKISDNIVEYEVNNDSKNAIINKYFGKKLTITDRADWPTEDILAAYYEQDCIEKIFRDTKNTSHFSLRPIFHWTDQKIRVHVFICLLGLILAAVLQKELKAKGVVISKDKLIESLSQIRQCWVKDNNSNTITKVLEDMDSELLNIWNIINQL